MRLIAEALGLRCKVLSLISGNATLIDVDGHPLLESLDVRDEGKVGNAGLRSDVRVPFFIFQIFTFFYR